MIKKPVLFASAALMFGLVNLTFGQGKSSKRGICGDASPDDLAVLAPSISWYYDWGVAPPAVSEGQLSGIEWVQVSGPNTASFSNTAIAQPTVSNLIEGTYVFRIALTANGETDYDEVSVSVGSTNIALNKPITASSLEGTTTPATGANDGNLTTRWSSAFSDPQMQFYQSPIFPDN